MFRTLFIGVVAALSISFIYNFYQIIIYNEKPEIVGNLFWGTKGNCRNDTTIYPFKIDIKQEEIDDLISRMVNTREFTQPLENTQNQYGLNGQVLEVIRKFVIKEYNFRERQIFLNKYSQFTTNIQGLKIHFLHVKSRNKLSLPVIPILLLHGWPSSVREFYESIPIFMSYQYQFAIDLVIPSLVGFGYSDGSSKPQFRSANAANIMKILMERLGYKRYLVHGSDWGSVVATNMATLYPKSILGFHSNFCFSFRIITFLKILLSGLYPPAVVDKKYENKLYPLNKFVRFLFAESGYLHLMGTKPDTIGHILDNTPMGLIIFLFEKLSVGKNTNYIYSQTSGLENFNLTEVMDIFLFYYWFPKKATTAARFYGENLSVSGLLEGLHNIPIDQSVPCACTFFEDEFLYMPENFLRDKYTNIVQYKTYPAIGHFAAIEANDLLTNDIISFAKKIFLTKH